MANFKICVSDPASKKAHQKEIDQAQSGMLGKKIGDKVQGDSLGLPGYEIEITGGSDNDGFPMRKDVEGPARKKIILTSPPGYHPTSRGKRKRKSVRGNTISQDISQVNLKVVKSGPKDIEQLFGKADGKKQDKQPEKEDKPAEKQEKPQEKLAEPKDKPAEDAKQPEKQEAPKEPAKPEPKKKQSGKEAKSAEKKE